jgi:amidase
LVAMRGSVLGIGTDIAGSIRIPALCCGTYGFKPSANRVPYSGQAEPVRDGMPGVIPAAGPICTSTRDMIFFMEKVISKDPWDFDAKALYMPWRVVEGKTKLRIGILPPDPNFPLTPPVARAIAVASKKLSESGHEVVELENIPSIKSATDLCAEYFYLDNTNVPFQHIQASGEPVIPSIATVKFAHKDSYNLDDLFRLNSQRDTVEEDWRNVFVQQKLDVIVAPAAGTTAIPHDTYGTPP